MRHPCAMAFLLKRLTSWPLIALFCALLQVILLPAVQAVQLVVREVAPIKIELPALEKHDQLPHSRVTRGSRNIAAAWLSAPTDRYPHGVLGDRLESSTLMVETSTGRMLQTQLPCTRVFEDLQARLADIDDDGRDEILVVESDMALGSALAVYAVQDRRLVRVTATSFIGHPNRWLNPLGAGDFNGDGQLDIALVGTPHIGGVLRLYEYAMPELKLFAEYKGVSTHEMGSTELGFGRVVSAHPRDLLLVPDQARSTMLLLEWSPGGWQIKSRVALTARIASSLIPSGDNRWRLRLDNGKHIEIDLQD